jgi:hypothetical protein
MYRIDSLHPDRVVCDACATAIGPVMLDAADVPLGALPSADAAAEWPELASRIHEHDVRCRCREHEHPADDTGEVHHLIEQQDVS